jgi:hypothetical protein
MKHSLNILVAVALIGLSSAAYAQNTSGPVTGYAYGTVIAGIALVETQDLSFGDFISSNAVGTVVVTNTGGFSYTGGVSTPGTQHPDGTPKQAIWDVTGQASYKFDFTAPGVITYGASPAWPAGMTITLNSLAGANPYTLTAGDNYYGQGATLHVPPNAPPGHYTASWVETVNYQ